MVALVRNDPLELGGTTPAEARAAIRALLEADPKASRRTYAALARKTWALLVERRFDPEVRDWHALVQSVKATIQASDGTAAERLAALADLLGQSVSFSEISPARKLAERPVARAILYCLAEAGTFLKRQALREHVGVGNSHLSNVLTELIAQDLVERQAHGKHAQFRITSRGRAALGLDAAMSEPPVDLLYRNFVDLFAADTPVLESGSRWRSIFGSVSLTPGPSAETIDSLPIDLAHGTGASLLSPGTVHSIKQYQRLDVLTR